MNLWDLPFLAITPIILYTDNLNELFLTNKAMYEVGKSASIRGFWIHKNFRGFCAALQDVLSPEAANNILTHSHGADVLESQSKMTATPVAMGCSSTSSCIDAFPLSLLCSEETSFNLLRSFYDQGLKELWGIMIVVAARWGHCRVLKHIFNQKAFIDDAREEEMIQRAVEISIAFAQLQFMRCLLIQSSDKFSSKIPLYLKQAVQMDRPTSVELLLSILKEDPTSTTTASIASTTTNAKKQIYSFLQEAVVGGKFKSLQVLLTDISWLDRTSWLKLVALASNGGSHEMIRLILKSGEALEREGERSKSSDTDCVNESVESESIVMQGWKLGMDCAIQRGRPAMVEYLLNLSRELEKSSMQLQHTIPRYLELAAREGKTDILWTILDSAASVCGRDGGALPTAVNLLAGQVLIYYANQFEKDSSLVLDKEGIRNIRGRDSKGILPILRGLIRDRKASFSESVGRNLLLMAVTWNLPATYEFLEDQGASLGDTAEPVVECLLRIIRAGSDFDIPNSSLIMKLVNHRPANFVLFEEGVLQTALSLPESECFLKKRKQVWEAAVKLTPSVSKFRSDVIVD
ncbi:hypothetical protein BDR26DRAFT_865855 [Obelidium mucronatum]|nr:hypothetical protein BDR26DRAFT_865855 [Obelidium mucronatum]